MCLTRLKNSSKKEGTEIQVSFKGYRKEDRLWMKKSVLKSDLGRTVYKKLYDEMK